MGVWGKKIQEWVYGSMRMRNGCMEVWGMKLLEWVYGSMYGSVGYGNMEVWQYGV